MSYTGDSFVRPYRPYIIKKAIEEGIEPGEAGQNLKDELGVGWVSELTLVNIVRKLFPEEKVLHQGRPSWLKPQSLDVFIPRLNLAIEYQGEQHFIPIDHYGGEAALARNQERDRRKAKACADNGVELIYFHYDEDFSEWAIREKLRRWLPRSTTD